MAADDGEEETNPWNATSSYSARQSQYSEFGIFTKTFEDANGKVCTGVHRQITVLLSEKLLQSVVVLVPERRDEGDRARRRQFDGRLRVRELHLLGDDGRDGSAEGIRVIKFR